MHQIYVISGPSGVGKTSLITNLLSYRPDLEQVVSYTTRAQRFNETNGIHYHFISRDDFIKKEQQNDFIESTEIFGNKYGISKSNIENILKEKNVILIINWEGFVKIKSVFPKTIGIFIMPPSITELRARITKRATDSSAEIEKRLEIAQQDIRHSDLYDFVVINNDLNLAVQQIDKLIS